MITRIPYKDVEKRHPNELKELRKRVYASKSKHKNRATSDWLFAYKWNITEESGFAVYRSYSKWLDTRLVQKVVEEAKKAHIELIANPNPKGGRGYTSVMLHELPDEVLMEILINEIRNEARYEDLRDKFGIKRRVRLGRAGKRTVQEIQELFARVRKELPAKKPSQPAQPRVKKPGQPVKRDKYEAVKV